ncbi:MAG TPA: zf-HC2 domain-containing protein [Actinomycetota bacterium]
MKPSCEEVLRDIEVYLDGELPNPEAAALAEHLGACPECLEHEAFISRLRATLRTKLGASSEVPDSLVDRIRRTIATS